MSPTALCRRNLYRELDVEGIDRELLKRSYSAALINLSALLEIAEGPTRRNVELNEEALGVARRLGDAVGVAVALGNLAEAASRDGDEPGARALFAEAIAASAALQSRQRLVEAYWQVGSSELKFGNPQLAREAFTAALEAALPDGRDVPINLTHFYLAVCDVDEGLPGSGQRFREAAARVFAHPEMQGEQVMRHIAVVVAADVALDEGRLDHAAALLGASEAITEAGTVIWHEFESRRDRVEERLRETLGDRFAQARMPGHGWSAAETLAAISS